MRLKANGNVFVTSSGYAYDACKAASPIHKVSAMQKHKKEKDQGKQYYHYHPMLKWSKNKNARKQSCLPKIICWRCWTSILPKKRKIQPIHWIFMT